MAQQVMIEGQRAILWAIRHPEAKLVYRSLENDREKTITIKEALNLSELNLEARIYTEVAKSEDN